MLICLLVFDKMCMRRVKRQWNVKGLVAVCVCVYVCVCVREREREREGGG